MNHGAAFRGQPLLLLVVLLAGWFAVRAALWRPPLGDLAAASLTAPIQGWYGEATALADGHLLEPPRETAPWNSPFRAELLLSGPRSARPARSAEAAQVEVPAAINPAARLPARVLIGHNLLLAAGVAQMELPSFLAAYLQDGEPPPGVPAAAPLRTAAPPARAAASPSRWSADGWVLLRQGSAAALVPGQPTYGRSQAGGVVRYSLAPASAHRPLAYLRASSALSGPREREIAAGFSARPLARLPLRIAAEARVSETAAGTELRPAAYAVTELPSFPLPLGARGEVYVQGGYVGGRYATAFVDGQGRVDRRIARWGETELSVGAGAWGGAQKGSARLDLGPTAAVAFRLGETRGRVAADYRFRVAGEAEPASGPALTVSAGF